MGYFGGGGVAGKLHPSLQAYIDCFQSPPFPRAFPRGGGIWDQDPILMRDFRAIREFEIQWKETQEVSTRASEDTGASENRGHGDLEDMLNEMLEERGESGNAYF